MNGIDKREVERFRMALEIRLAVLSDPKISSGPRPAAMITRNISSDGAFIVTDSPLDIGTRVDVGLCLPYAAGKSNVQVKGRVIRVEVGGMAVRFEKQYRIRPAPPA